MGTTVEGPDRMVPKPEHVHQQDLVINRDDEFDFEIGGGDNNFDLAEDAGNQDPEFIDQVDAAEAHDDQSYMYQPEDYGSHVSYTESYNVAGVDSGLGDTEMAPFGLDSLTEAVDATQDAENHVQTDFDVAGQEGEHQSNVYGSHEEIYYDDAGAESEYQDENAQSAPLLDVDLTGAATSVGFAHEGDEIQENSTEANEDDAETYHNAPSEPQSVEDRAQNAELAGAYENADHTDGGTIAADAKRYETVDQTIATELAKNEAFDDAIDASLDQSNWNQGDDDDDEARMLAGPIVTVSYSGQEYSMFAQSSEDDPDTYFLDDVESVHQPLSQFLATLRAVISSELEAGQELFVRVDGLGLEFGESTAKEFLDHKTLAEIIDVNDKLSQHDGGSQHAELYIFLSVQSSPLHRFMELARGVEEGQGLSHFEQYYEPSGDSQHALSSEFDETTDGADELLKAQASVNPFRINDEQQSVDGTFAYTNAEAEAAEKSELAITQDSNPFNAVNGSRGLVDDGDEPGVVALTTQPVSTDENFNEVASKEDRTESTETGEDWAHESGVQIESVEDVGGATEVQTEVLIDNFEESHKSTDDNLANMATDDDYLDLGDDVAGDRQSTDQVTTTNGNVAGQLDIDRQITPNSSATGTLNGEETGHGTEAALHQPTTADTNQTPNGMTTTDSPQDEGDEIDWNHDEDNEISDASQNPTGLSPSSLSSKRGRQDEEAFDGLGDDTAAKRRRT